MAELRELTESCDRSQTFALFERLCRERDPKVRGDLSHALACLDDARLLPDLTRCLSDTGVARATRVACARILRDMANGPSPTGGQLRAWWASGDEVLRTHALLQMTQRERDLVDAVLGDDSHPLLRDAMHTLMFDFSSQATTERLVRGLGHADARVREAAADALVWDEPVAACEALLKASGDSDAEVAIAALDTLCYYPTLGTIRAAARAKAHRDPRVQEAGKNCFLEVRNSFLLALVDPKTELHLRRWLAPVKDLLEIQDEEIEELREPDPAALRALRSPIRKRFEWMASPASFAAHFNAEGPWRERESELYQADWATVPESQRDAFSALLQDWPDVAVRESAARAFVASKDRPRIAALLEDPCFGVRKTAMYTLRDFGADAEFAERAWNHLPYAWSTHAYETLETAIALSPSGSWVERVEAIAADDKEQESTRFHAIEALGKAGVRHAIEANLGLLQKPPILTWAIHESLARWARRFELPLPDLRWLRDVDHLMAQEIVAGY
ncbi:MAG: hypothetical protein AAGE52_29670 [Myxococcota bacterium]